MARAMIDPTAPLALVRETRGVTVTEHPDNPTSFEIVVTDANGRRVSVTLTREEARVVGMTLLGTPEWA